VLGVYFGVVLVKSEVASWFRIQEMFRFQAFHMYGIIGSAVVVAGSAVAIVRRRGMRSLGGEAVDRVTGEERWDVRHAAGGTVFGLGWALTGACPGPLFALVGSGVIVMGVALIAALAGTWTYGALRPRLPH
jgi:hypothetical protein